MDPKYNRYAPVEYELVVADPPRSLQGRGRLRRRRVVTSGITTGCHVIQTGSAVLARRTAVAYQFGLKMHITWNV